MRGLPPPPNDTFSIRWTYDVDSSFCTSTTWYTVAGLSTFSIPELIDLADAIAFWWLDLYASVVTSEVELAVYRATFYTGERIVHHKALTPTHGIWPGRPTLNACTCITWSDGLAGKRGHATSYFPGFAPDFTDNHRDLNSNGYIGLRDAAFAYLDGVRGVPTPNEAALLPVVLHRAAHGVPLDDANVGVVIDASPSLKVGTLRRRVRTSGRISPS
jgi:hypothetical protein